MIRGSVRLLSKAVGNENKINFLRILNAMAWCQTIMPAGYNETTSLCCQRIKESINFEGLD
jgi:hypothetical protein